MKKIFLTVTMLLSIIITGCAPSSTAVLRENQNNEIVMLQDAKKQILMRPANTPKEMLTKKADLKLIDEQIMSAMIVQQNAQSIQNQKTSNTIKSVITGVGAVGAAAVGVHELTK